MAVTNELAFPTTEDQFEEMCFHLYRKEWNDPGCVRLGGVGQAQFGLDILGANGAQQIGVQCKHYVKKPFTLATVQSDVEKVDKAGLSIDHVIFATTAANKTELVLKVLELSHARKKAGKFTVSVAFWQELSGMLRLNKEVAREYIPGFPGGTLLQVREITATTLAIVKSSSEREIEFHADVRNQFAGIAEHMSSAAAASSLPQSQGTEAEPLIANSLDIVRSKLLEARPKEAVELLESLGNPDRFRDTYSQFRWHTNRAAAHLLEGRTSEAAREYLVAASKDSKLEKAWCNRAHAHLLLNDVAVSLKTSLEGLQTYPESAPLWALHVAAKLRAEDTNPERDVPKHIMETSDFRFTLSHVRYKQGRLEESFDLLRLCVEADAPSLEIRRHYLAAALSWTTVDPVAARQDQLQPKQRKALADALLLLEPLEATLASLQVEGISEELANNVCVALLLAQSVSRARAIATTALVRHPNLEGLLRIRINELASQDNFADLHKLTDGRYDELPISTLAALAEVAANKGDLVWHQTSIEALATRELDENLMVELRALTIHTHWQAGEKVEAIQMANDFLVEYPNHILTHVLLSRMLKQQGDVLAAGQQANLAMTALQPDSPIGDVLYVADLMFEDNLYPEASELYQRIATSPGANTLTQRNLTCLIESGQRRKASEILEALPAHVRNMPSFRRIEANLARLMGDWCRMRDVLKQELVRMPTDSGIAIGYIGALHRIPNEKDVLTAYLASDPVYDGRQPLNEVEVAKYQREHGFFELALKRLYRVFRAHPNDSELGGYFMMQLLIGDFLPQLHLKPVAAAPGVWAHLRAGNEVRDIAIDFDEVVLGARWPELLTQDSDIARKLFGKIIGDKVTIARGIGDVEYEVVNLSPLYSFAAQKVHKLLAESADPVGPLWSINLAKSDGSIDIEPLLEMTRRKSASITNAVKNYSHFRFPLAMLARLVGTEPLALMLNWPRSKASLFVGTGTEEERHEAFSLLAAGDKRFVVDLPTLGELVGTDMFRTVAALLNRPLIPQNAREELINIIKLQETLPSTMSLSGEDGQDTREETTQEQIDRQLTLLKEMLNCIDDLCEVTPVLGPKEITENHRGLENLLDHATLDAVYLALERNAVLLSDDGGLRRITPAVGLVDSMATQPLLMFAMNRGILAHSSYVDVVMGKLARNHDFISVNTNDLVALARRETGKVAAGIVATFITFRSRNLDLISAFQVCASFLIGVVPLCQPSVTAEYFKLALAALQHERHMHADAVHHALIAAMEQALRGIPKRKAHRIRLEMGALLKQPELQPQRIRMTPIARAVEQLIVRL